MNIYSVNKLLALKTAISSVTLCRNITLSAVNYLKRINVSDKGDTILVEAVKVKSDRTDKLVAKEHTGTKDCCPLCRLNLRRLAYTDVLILSQFVESNGKVMPRSVTGLCAKMHNKVTQLVNQAQQCQLMSRPIDYVSYGPWDQLNTYQEWPQRIRDKPISIIEPKYWTSDYDRNVL